MTRYHFDCNFDLIFSLEGWADVALSWDADGELTSIDVERIEIEPSLDRCMKIQRGYVPVKDTMPESAVWEAIRERIVEHLNSDKIGKELIDASHAQGDHPDSQQFGVGA